jgi:hypothetical protein
MSSVTQANPVRVYVAHLWAEDDDYLRVFEYLESADKFYYANRSAPDRLPEGDKEGLRQAGAGHGAVRRARDAAALGAGPGR